ncbi:hypothetical protein AXF42_Ash007974 [Apostasia shenzhenica]|uniref:RNase H type-1 domain-containing protein n=1 Tax=Apostasia shenzhenica TaxID=1088818 RepID=A0A2I0B5U6_9ASPA|nr:hypothetical protein AXF42_Ash007974 [Apostasia shenzhenica]
MCSKRRLSVTGGTCCSAELHAAFLAADLVKPWIGKFQGVWFEGDSEHTIQQLHSAVQHSYHASTIDFYGFLSVLSSFQHYKISHVYRQANMAAHYVASSSFATGHFQGEGPAAVRGCRDPLMLVIFWGRVSVRKSVGPVRHHVFGQDAAQEPRVNISPPHCQGANINMSPGMRTVAKMDELPEVYKDKMGAESAASHSILPLSV